MEEGNNRATYGQILIQEASACHIFKQSSSDAHENEFIVGFLYRSSSPSASAESAYHREQAYGKAARTGRRISGRRGRVIHWTCKVL